MYFLLLASIVLVVVKNTVYNSFAKSSDPDQYDIFRYNAVSYAVAAIVALAFGFEKNISFETLIVASFYAFIVCSLQGLSVYAMKIGPMSATSLLVLYGMIIPAIAGPIFWKEPFSILQGIGVILVLVSMWLLRKEEATSKTADKKWGIIALVLFFLSGFAGLAEKIHQSTNGRDEKNLFIFVAYIIMFVISLIGMMLSKKSSQKPVPIKRLWPVGALSGLIITLYAMTNLTLAGKLDSMIYYPVSNGGALILTVIVSVTLFHEKCSKKRIIGFVIGLLSVLILSLPV